MFIDEQLSHFLPSDQLGQQIKKRVARNMPNVGVVTGQKMAGPPVHFSKLFIIWRPLTSTDRQKDFGPDKKQLFFSFRTGGVPL
jgi:hypothetical protein